METMESWADEMDEVDACVESGKPLPVPDSSLLVAALVTTELPEQPPFRLFVANVAPDTTSETLVAAFGQLHVEEVYWHRDSAGHPSGQAAVQFSTRDHLQAALRLEPLEVCGRRLRLQLQPEPSEEVSPPSPPPLQHRYQQNRRPQPGYDGPDYHHRDSGRGASFNRDVREPPNMGERMGRCPPGISERDRYGPPSHDDRDSYGPAYERDRPGSHYERDRPGPHYERGRPGLHYERDRPGPNHRDRPSHQYERERPGPHYERDRPGSHYDRDRSGTYYERDRSGPHYERDRYDRSFNGPHRGEDRFVSEANDRHGHRRYDRGPPRCAPPRMYERDGPRGYDHEPAGHDRNGTRHDAGLERNGARHGPGYSGPHPGPAGDGRRFDHGADRYGPGAGGDGSRHGDGPGHGARRDDRQRDSQRPPAARGGQPASAVERMPDGRPKLNLKPRSVPADDIGKPAAAAVSSIFGGAKPVDTAARERQIEERLRARERDRMGVRHRSGGEPPEPRRPRRDSQRSDISQRSEVSRDSGAGGDGEPESAHGGQKLGPDYGPGPGQLRPHHGFKGRRQRDRDSIGSDGQRGDESAPAAGCAAASRRGQRGESVEELTEDAEASANGPQAVTAGKDNQSQMESGGAPPLANGKPLVDRHTGGADVSGGHGAYDDSR